MEREVLSRFVKYKDLEVHISKLIENDRTYLDVREYIPSLDRYGRGTTATGEAVPTLLEGLSRW